MKRRIHIMGASGAGTTTLGKALAARLPHVQLDSDDYFWEQKYSRQTDVTERLNRLGHDLKQQEPWILTGAICGWGDALRGEFDLVIFLWLPPQLRLERLRVREYERYGDEALPGGSKYDDVQEFMAWAALYDTAGPEVRSKVLHEEWMSGLTCDVLRLEGDLTVEERVAAAMQYFN
ncbi:AAA family ATPase [Paenibacillus sp. MMS20-IR301]|uniref:AAA family ATPase n=1 Tax=Paenibacillus sp. MMS20-IR301 TaxID=2895946 RepID=UPI0028E89BE6|nr:AAA family ATPase [Paenibacillus sp. MMS20-IR301]WNS45903.1 AAA family ATPase [Paenibacillus sp. MMS20-IR301]